MKAATAENFGEIRSGLSVPKALRMAWIFWAIFLLIPFTVIFWFIWHASASQNPLSQVGHERWFVAAMAYLGLVAPAAFFWREHVFKDYREGKPVPPGKYLAGMIGVWLALETSGLFSLVGCIVIGALLPNLIPAFLALMLFLMLWPSGRSMVRSVGNEEDAQLYEEPR